MVAQLLVGAIGPNRPADRNQPAAGRTGTLPAVPPRWVAVALTPRLRVDVRDRWDEVAAVMSRSPMPLTSRSTAGWSVLRSMV